MKRNTGNKARRILRTLLIAALALIACLALTAWIIMHASNSVSTQIDPYVYRLPYQPGTAHEVVQGYGGLFSHSHQAALDFEMKPGTGVYAARR